MLTREEVLKIAKLAKIRLSEEEIVKYQKDLSGILDWIGVLNELDTENVETTSQVTGLVNVWRTGDQISPFGKEKELVACTPNKVIDQQIALKNIMK